MTLIKDKCTFNEHQIRKQIVLTAMFSENIGDNLSSIFHGPRPVPSRSGRMITSGQGPFFGILGPHGLHTYPIVLQPAPNSNTRYSDNNSANRGKINEKCRKLHFPAPPRSSRLTIHFICLGNSTNKQDSEGFCCSQTPTDNSIPPSWNCCSVFVRCANDRIVLSLSVVCIF